MSRLAWASAVWALAGAGAARATEEAPIPEEPAIRRSGLAVGVSSGLAVGGASGYPNDVAKIDLPEFEASTGVGANVGGSAWIGGSLTDWLTIGVGYQLGGFESNGLRASGRTLHLRIESFPLFALGGPWQDLGVAFLAGTGNYDVKRAGSIVAEGEGTSVVGIGTFYEPWRFWRFSAGPDVSYVHHFSRSLSAHTFVVGFRLAYYAGP